jgi:hypothetical protein
MARVVMVAGGALGIGRYDFHCTNVPARNC